MTEKLLEGRIALITGASRGLGAAVAEAFAREGAHVILLARGVKGLEDADDRIRAAGGTATLLPFDLMQMEKAGAVAAAIAEKFGRLDILVGNAAILGDLTPVVQADPRMWERVFRVNFFANVALVKAFDPLLRASGAGRVIFTTSGVTRMQAPYWGAYAASKAALEAMASSYAAEVAYSGLKVNVVDPGVLRTDLRAEAFPGENPLNLPLPETAARTFVDLAAPAWQDTGRIVEAAAA